MQDDERVGFNDLKPSLKTLAIYLYISAGFNILIFFFAIIVLVGDSLGG